MTTFLDVALVASAVTTALSLLALADEALIRHTTRSKPLSPDTLTRLAQMRRDRRLAHAIFLGKVFGPAAAFLAYLGWVTR